MLNNAYNKIYFNIILFLVLTTLTVQASEIIKNNHKEEVTSLVPRTIKLVETNNKIEILHNGHRISLPKFTNEIERNKWQNNFVATIPEEKFSSFVERKEIVGLSNKLGFPIRDAKNLPLYREAAEWIGIKYCWAGKSKKGVDCSGLTGIIINNVYNVEIARSSYIIANHVSEELNVDELQPGDLLFFSTMRRKNISHVGIYLGDGNFIHASRRGVVVSHLDDSYYSRTFKKAGRL